MFSRLRNHFGTAGLVVAIVALIAALAGGAVAANSGGGDNATASAKAKKGPRGPRGPRGPAGAPGLAGLAGATGPAGAPGLDGLKGATGATGATGTNGTSVVSSVEPPGGNCADAGSKFVAGASTTYACNGANGQDGTNGANGSPWTAGGTLPVGATQKGTWAFNAIQAQRQSFISNLRIFLPISFPIPLAASRDLAHTIFVGPGGGNPTCTGNVVNPTAPNGYLCVYAGALTNATVGVSGINFVSFSDTGTIGADPSGTLVPFNITADPGSGSGTWAVTG